MAKFTVEFDTSDARTYQETVYWLVKYAGPFNGPRAFLEFVDEFFGEMPDAGEMRGHWVEAERILRSHITKGFLEMHERWAENSQKSGVDKSVAE